MLVVFTGNLFKQCKRTQKDVYNKIPDMIQKSKTLYIIFFIFLISMTRRKKSHVFSETQNQRFVAQVKHLRVKEQLCLCRGRKLWILSTRGLCCARGTDVNMERSTLLRVAPDWHTVPHSWPIVNVHPVFLVFSCRLPPPPSAQINSAPLPSALTLMDC